MIRLLAALAATLSIAPAFAADLAEIAERGVLRVAVSPLSPFVIKDESGAYRGLEIDATRALAESLGVDVDYVEAPFCSLADAIVNDEADLIASGYSNTAVRRQVLDFSLPYHDTHYFLLVRKEKAKSVKSLRGFNDRSITITYQQGGVSGDVAATNFSGADLLPSSSFPEIIDALQSGEADGAVVFSPYQDHLRKSKKPKFTVPHEFALTRTIEAYGFEKGAEDLREALNAWILEREREGYWAALEEKWFDPENADISVRPAVSCPAMARAG